MRWGLVLIVAGFGLGGCAPVRAVVTDRASGVAVVQARAVDGTGRELAVADDQGRLDFTPPAGGEVAIQAQGFLRQNHPAAWWAAQPQPVAISLAPVWLEEFQQKGTGKPSQIIERKPCPCHRSQ